MKVKVCGLLEPENIAAIAAAGPDMMGFIFYKKSPRYAGELDPAVVELVPAHIQRVGVFVNSNQKYILDTVEKFSLDAVQLHGDEPPLQCRELRKTVKVIKAFGVQDRLQLDISRKYENACDMFLFDTKTVLKGGSGKKFDHSLMHDYVTDVPWFLSGGIAPEDVAILKNAPYVNCLGVDINSRFEVRPGLKDEAKVKKFIKEFRKS